MSNLRSVSPFSNLDGMFTKVTLYLKEPLTFQQMAQYVNEIEEALGEKQVPVEHDKVEAIISATIHQLRRLVEHAIREKIMEEKIEKEKCGNLPEGGQ